MATFKEFDPMEKLMYVAFVAIVIGTLSFVAAMIVSKGNADFCYIDSATLGKQVSVKLMAHVPFRADRFIDYFDNSAAAIEAAKNMKCPLEGK